MMTEVRNVTLTLENTTILKDISFAVSRSEKAVIFGESGAGKTSVLKCILGIYRPQQGSVLVEGSILNERNIGEIRRKVCYMPQFIQSFPEETTLEFIERPFSFRANQHLRPNRTEILGLFDKLQLREALLSMKMQSLSGGEKQRVGLVRATLLKRILFILDEVTSSIDDENRQKVMDFLFNNDGITVLSVSHDGAWKKAATKRIEMVDGLIKAIS
jgi:putative ABC transport system ATP-binding protein